MRRSKSNQTDSCYRTNVRALHLPRIQSGCRTRTKACVRFGPRFGKTLKQLKLKRSRIRTGSLEHHVLVWSTSVERLTMTSRLNRQQIQIQTVGHHHLGAINARMAAVCRFTAALAHYASLGARQGPQPPIVQTSVSHSRR